MMGVFGVVWFAVGRRTREIGVRIALGAKPAHIYASVIGDGVRPVAAGLLSGAAIAILTAIGFARLLEGFRFAISPTILSPTPRSRYCSAPSSWRRSPCRRGGRRA